MAATESTVGSTVASTDIHRSFSPKIDFPKSLPTRRSLFLLSNLSTLLLSSIFGRFQDLTEKKSEPKVYIHHLIHLLYNLDCS